MTSIQLGTSPEGADLTEIHQGSCACQEASLQGPDCCLAPAIVSAGCVIGRPSIPELLLPVCGNLARAEARIQLAGTL